MEPLSKTPQTLQEAPTIRGLGEVASGLRELQQACGCQPATIHHALPELLALLADLADNLSRAKLAADRAMEVMGPEFEGAMAGLFNDPEKLARALQDMDNGGAGAADFGSLVESGAFGAADGLNAETSNALGQAMAELDAQENILGQTLQDATQDRLQGTV